MSETERDLSRAHWQRSEAMVLYSGLADRLFADSEAALPDEWILTILGGEKPPFRDHDMASSRELTPLQTQAYRIGQYAFMSPYVLQRFEDMPYAPSPSMSKNLDLYTYEYKWRQLIGTVREVTKTMACFPLNVVFTMGNIAMNQGLPEYEVNSLTDIATALRRDDTRELIDTAAFTVNSYWGPQSIEPSPVLLQHTASGRENVIVYDVGAETMRLAPSILESMRACMVRNNKQGGSGHRWSLPEKASSGCPARHLRPHFTHSDADRQSIAELATFFGTTAEGLLAPRMRTAIDVGLDYLCEGFDRAAHLQAEMHTTAPTALAASV